jgi:hypothetical protein
MGKIQSFITCKQVEHTCTCIFEPCFLLRWLRSNAFRPGILPSFTPPTTRGIRVVNRLPLAHHPFLSRDFPFLPRFERKTSFVEGRDKRAVFAYHRSGELDRYILFRSGISKLSLDSPLRPLRARGLLVAIVM